MAIDCIKSSSLGDINNSSKYFNVDLDNLLLS